MKLDDAEIWLRQVAKCGLADPETVKAIKVVLEELQSLHEEIEELHDTIETLNEDIDYWKYKDCDDDTDWTHWEDDEEKDECEN